MPGDWLVSPEAASESADHDGSGWVLGGVASCSGGNAFRRSHNVLSFGCQRSSGVSFAPHASLSFLVWRYPIIAISSCPVQHMANS